MRHIRKIASNNVEVVEAKQVPDMNGNPVKIRGASESYGQDRITTELEVATSKLTAAKNLDANQYKRGIIQEAKDTIQTLNDIQQEMDKP